MTVPAVLYGWRKFRREFQKQQQEQKLHYQHPSPNVHNQEPTQRTGALVGSIRGNWVVLNYKLQKVQGTFQGDLLVLKEQKQKMHLYTDILRLLVDTEWSLDEIIPFMRA